MQNLFQELKEGVTTAEGQITGLDGRITNAETQITNLVSKTHPYGTCSIGGTVSCDGLNYQQIQ